MTPRSIHDGRRETDEPPAVHMVHGFNVRDKGAGTMDLLAPYFDRFSFRVIDHDYGWMGLLGAWTCNGNVATLLGKAVRKGDIGCGHSNGCAVLTRAADEGAPFVGLVFINPALDCDIKIAPQVKWVHVYYNPDDAAVKWAELIPHWINKRWGDMGARGYLGSDPRVTSFNCLDGPVPVSGHSDIFRKLEPWGYAIAARARAELA